MSESNAAGVKPRLECTQANVYVTIDCPLCGGDARTPIPERWGEATGVLTCSEDRGGCGGEFELAVCFR